jgi:hypothetical protein
MEVFTDAALMFAYTVDMFFRGMTPADDGLPVVARSARALGVRVPEDVRLDAESRVLPGRGGMSVAPGSMWNLPNHRRPRGMWRGSTGPADDHVFSLAAVCVSSAGLSARLDPQRPLKHAFIEPRSAVELSLYEAMLASSRPDWQQEWP